MDGSRIVVFISLGIICISQIVSPADGIKCYQCSVLGCGDDFNPKATGVMQQTCSGSCMKTKSEQGVIRLCIDAKLGDDRCEEEGDVESCACSTDLCNMATQLHVSMATLTTMLAAFLLSKFL